MEHQELIKYCFYYNGSPLPDGVDVNSPSRLLWLAEKTICEELPHLISKSNTRLDMAKYIIAYVGKWQPFNIDEVMDVYFANIPDLKDKVIASYN